MTYHSGIQELKTVLHLVVKMQMILSKLIMTSSAFLSMRYATKYILHYFIQVNSLKCVMNAQIPTTLMEFSLILRRYGVQLPVVPLPQLWILTTSAVKRVTLTNKTKLSLGFQTNQLINSVLIAYRMM